MSAPGGGDQLSPEEYLAFYKAYMQAQLTAESVGRLKAELVNNERAAKVADEKYKKTFAELCKTYGLIPDIDSINLDTGVITRGKR